jgi:hypothetical protein
MRLFGCRVDNLWSKKKKSIKKTPFLILLVFVFFFFFGDRFRHKKSDPILVNLDWNL